MTGWRRSARLIAWCLFAAGSMLAVAACGGDDRLTEIPAGVATNELFIPPLLEPERTGPIANYDLELRRSQHDYGTGTTVDTYGYNGQAIFGPTLKWTTGDYVSIHVTNTLDEVTTNHWHGADVPADDDGGPHSPIQPGETWTADFPIIQDAATLWYHPHRDGTTSKSIHLGAVGMIIVEDDNPLAANLPNTYGVDDIPVILRNPDFDDDGQLAYKDEDDGGETAVNGTLDPFVNVSAGPVRLRILNASQKTLYEISSDNNGLLVIASDGGYLDQPVRVNDLTVTPGDRVEVIVDTREGIVNLTDDDYGDILELRPDPSLPVAPEPPEQLNNIDRIEPAEITAERRFRMDRVDGQWKINDTQMDMGRIDQTIQFGAVERWTLSSEEGAHSFHVHQTQFQILSINGRPPPPEETGWEDTVFVSERRTVEVAARFNTYTNPDVPYMFHCHILPHEERGMMGQFVVVGDGPADA
ncbi:MAG: multicopper oxidase domain-containing protein [Actinomycetota bacterium]